MYYTLGIAPPWHYSKIAYPEVDSGMEQLMDSLRATSLLRVGAQYNMDSLTLERKRICPACCATGDITISVPNTWNTWPIRLPVCGRSTCA